ncbi:MAG: hypothetical protein NTW13_03100 [Candidatus Omnitrophica bacterium]|nr:hypothetical protein [Candidatus Omnitrophota bacterium]
MLLSGCFLPFLIVFNLFFGWIFFKPLFWLASEAILILLFLFNSFLFKRRIASATKKRDNIIDVEGKIVD